jgi:hypothetical protein
MRDASHRAGKTRASELRLNAAAVYDGSLRPAQQLPQHRQAFVIRPHFQPPYASRVYQILGAAILLHRAQVRVPVAPFYRDVGDQMVQVRFVNHHHSGMIHRRLVTKIVISVVAHLIQRHIVLFRIEGGRLRRKHIQIHVLLQFFE